MREVIQFALVLGIVAVPLGLVACTRPQEYAGIAETEIHFSESGDVQKISNRSGREGEGLVLLVTQTDGTTVEIRADSVTGSDAIASRAALAEKLSEAGLTPSLELINAIIELLPAGAGKEE